jgi:AraC-like DNA-binding protein
MADDRASIEPLFAGSMLTLARFRCPPDDRRWFHENWIGDRAHVVFPHVPFAIRHRGRLALIADPTQAVLYRANEHYERDRLSPEGDRSTFLTIEPNAAALTAEIASTHVTVDAGDVLRVRVLAELARRAPVDGLAIEEEGLRLVDRILRRARLRAAAADRRRAGTREAHLQAVTDAQRYLAMNAALPRSLADVGEAVGVSPFHLARVFRAATGLSLHGYRDQVRLRMALDRIAEVDVHLATLAVELGFASHSHFDGRFMSTFGRSPSAVRALVRRGSAQTSTMMEALRGIAA